MHERQLGNLLDEKEMKMIGKPYAGELHVRFDEGEQVFVARQILHGHEVGNGGDS
jgi:hypothetical protein